MEGLHPSLMALWPVALLVLLRPALGVVTATVFAAVKATVDRSLPHNLPLAAGEWLRAELASRGMDREVDVLTAPGEQGAVDAYFPGAAFIQLSPETWLRNDAIGWATAAHELGHALNYRRSPLLHGVLVGARWGSRATLLGGVTFLLVNLLFGSPLLALATLALLVGSALLHALVLIDELWASRVGMAVLRQDGRVSPRLLDGAHVTMGAALLSYLGGFLSAAVLALGQGAIGPLTLEHHLHVPAEPLDGLPLALVVALSALLLARAALELVESLVPPRYAHPDDAEAALSLRASCEPVWALMLLILLYLLWNQPLGPVFTLTFALAAIPGVQALLRLLSPLLPVLLMPVLLVLLPLLLMAVPQGRLEEEPLDPQRTDQLAHRIHMEMEVGRRALQAAHLRLLNRPPLHLRLGRLVGVAYVPLLVAFWALLPAA